MKDQRKLDLTDEELRELADLLDTDASLHLARAREDELMERLRDQYGEKVFMHALREVIDLRQENAELAAQRDRFLGVYERDLQIQSDLRKVWDANHPSATFPLGHRLPPVAFGRKPPGVNRVGCVSNTPTLQNWAAFCQGRRAMPPGAVLVSV